MTQTHPLTPPDDLLQQLRRSTDTWLDQITIAYRAGADQELEACCKWLPKLPPWSADDLRRHRRPKPPSLKGQALQAWAAVEAGTDDQTAMAVIRRALEQLDD